MQDHYAGDIGDYVKLALLRHLSPGRKLGVAWYLYPDEPRDGGHIAYLQNPKRWRHLDCELFDALADVVQCERSVARLQAANILKATFADTRLTAGELPPTERCATRTQWLNGVLATLRDCDLVFADPDNGLVDDDPARRRKKHFGKRMPLAEAKAFADGRTAILYHHNTRFRGGHDLEIAYWLRQLGSDTVAVRANAYSCRTFFIVNPVPEIYSRANEFCERWSDHNVRFVDTWGGVAC